jgi:LuxR family transcriptional regulator, maltose regulon positive regulatory protein
LTMPFSIAIQAARYDPLRAAISWGRGVGMGVSDVRDPDSRARHGHRLVFDLLSSKLRCPPVRPGAIARPLLVERLRQDASRPIVSVVAPAGYGKTTLLSQWSDRNGQAFAWVSVDEGDNDPKVLLTYVAEALDAVEPIGERVFDALGSPASSVTGSVIPRLAAAFWSMTSPVVLIIDDVHVLHNRECQAALSVLAEHVPEGSRLVLAGRTAPPLRIGRLRAAGKILEIGARDLSLDRQEASSLLRQAEVALGEDEVAELHKQTEGWAAGLYLAALCIREGGSFVRAVASFNGGDRFINDYVEAEFLARISREQRSFLTRTAVLERLCGPLCDAVLEQDGSGAVLAGLERSNLLLVPLDRHGEWYRYHHLFRDMLLSQLERLEPELVPVLRRRAADWCLQNDLPEEALEYSMAAGDADAAARLVERLWDRAYRQGRVTTRRRWIQWLDSRGVIDRYPRLAVFACFDAADMGQPAEAERWADAVDRWQHGDAAADSPYLEAWAATQRAMLCRRGVEQMRADADEGARKLAALNIPAPFAVFLQGLARVFCGDPEGGGAFVEDAISMGNADGPDGRAWALCEQSLLAITRDDWSHAEASASRASSALHGTGMEDSYVTVLVCAVQARVAVHRGDAAAARKQLVSAQRLRHLLTYAYPCRAVQARIELIHSYLVLADLTAARTLMREIDEILRHRPGLGTLVDEAATLRDRLAHLRGPNVIGASALTAAELRLLPLLSTHLTFPEIGEELFLSRHTIKSQATSIYRKLDAGSRSHAVARARELGLLEG